MAVQPHPKPDIILHASCVALGDCAVLVRGASGSGKSSLALELLSRGATLVADDRTCLRKTQRGLIAYAPDRLLGLIEARMVGLLQAAVAAPTPVTLVVDLDQTEAKRLPDPRFCDLLGHSVPLLHKAETPHFPAAILQYLRGGPWKET